MLKQWDPNDYKYKKYEKIVLSNLKKVEVKSMLNKDEAHKMLEQNINIWWSKYQKKLEKMIKKAIQKNQSNVYLSDLWRAQKDRIELEMKNLGYIIGRGEYNFWIEWN